MTTKKLAFLMFILLCGLYTFGQTPRDELLKRVAIPSQKDLRGLVDLVGFSHTRDQTNSVVSILEKVERKKILENQRKYNFDSNTSFIAGICPHDDYFYAGRGYIQLMKYINAPKVILFGTCHWAKTYGLKDKFIFDSFINWRGPYGNIPISPVREEIKRGLDEEDYLVDDEVQTVEHSLEALLPFLQHFNRSVEIVPILVPYMNWEKMDELASRLASVLAEIIKKNNWKLGKDIAFLISTDCVHYGDYGWSYYNYCPFGTDADGYKKGVKQDMALIKNFLCGEIGTSRIRDFFWKCVEPNDPYQYKITWCGRFSVPMGLNFLFHLGRKLQHKPFHGVFLRYGTSLSFPAPPLEKLNLGTTYYSNLHHWVGFTSIGYLIDEDK